MHILQCLFYCRELYGHNRNIHIGKWRNPANGSFYRGRVIVGPSNAIDGATICLAGEITEELAGYQYERATSSDRE